MRKEYDFSKARKNPYASKLKRQITIRLDEGTVSYFKELAQDIGIPYQTLINMYLRNCATTRKKLSLQWKHA
ncbi:MAG: BrnA antitoxin family protein [Nitrospirota bacterium]